jgi:succinate dehydrogenase / fumarate reductase cytochrome b subunit
VSSENEGLASQSGRYHFLWRRLHSLTGIIPVGVFLCVHLSVNASAYFGADAFQANVDRIHVLGPILKPVEIVGIFIPIFFHAILGIQIWLTGQTNQGAYGYADNWRYTLQRYTGLVAFAFILLHLWHVHWLGAWLGGGWFKPHGEAFASAAEAIQASWVFPVLYLIGVIVAVYHFANGIWTFMITWGFTIGERAQRKMGVIAAAIGVVLLVAGLTSLFTLATAGEEETTITLPSEHAEQPVSADGVAMHSE